MLEELFAKANRLTLMWAFPFGAGLALFAADLIVFVLGDEWRGAIVLLEGLAVAVGAAAGRLQLVRVLPRARRVLAAGGRVGRVRRLLRRVRGTGRAARRLRGASSPAGSGAPRACWRSAHVYVRRLLPGVRLWALALRAAVPVVLASAPVVVLRLALWGGERTLAQALLELALWLGGLALATHRLESGLLAELRGYLRSGAPA